MNNNTFAVLVGNGTTGKFYKQAFINEVTTKYPWLTVAGLDDPYTLKNGRTLRGVQHAGAGNLVTVGTAKHHDINWVENPEFAAKKGYQPIYDLVTEYNAASNALRKYAMAKKPQPKTQTVYVQDAGSVFYACGAKVEVFDNFFKIGTHIIPRVATATSFYGYTPAQMDVIKKVIVTVKTLY